MTTNSPLFDEKMLRRLERLALVIRRLRGGRGQGDHRSQRRGASVEFADYRDYTPGDDLRHLNWHIYARLERPFIKLFEEEEDLTVLLILDASQSMGWTAEDDSVSKWNFARRLVGALGYLALNMGDRLVVATLYSGQVQLWSPQQGRGRAHTLFSQLSQLTPTGTTSLNVSLPQLTRRGLGRRPSLTFLVSDLLDPKGVEIGLTALQQVGHEVNLLHVLSPEELEPTLGGDLCLHDVETGQVQEVTINADLRRLYQAQVTAWRDGVEQFCFRRDINYVTLSSADSFEAILFGHLRRRGFVK